MTLAHIGAGKFSRAAHGPVLRRLADEHPPRVLLGGIADVDDTRPERAWQFRQDFGYDAAYRGVDEMLTRVRPDVAVCIVETARTADIAAELLRRGIPVLLEKPPGESIDDALMLADVARTSGTPHYVAFNRRRTPAIELARNWVRDYGPPRFAVTEMLRQNRHDARFGVRTGIHAVDTLRYLVGDVAWMHAIAPPPGRSSRDYRASVRFTSGTRGEIWLAMDAGVTRETYLLEYEDATRVEVTMSAPYSDASIWAGFRVTRRDRVLVERRAAADQLVAIGIVGEYDAFFEALAAGRQPDCTLFDASLSMSVAEGLENGYHGDPRPLAHRSCSALTAQ